MLALIGLTCACLARTNILEYRGADVSFVPQVEQAGAVYRSKGAAVDPIQLMAQRGQTIARIRIWNNPPDGHSGIPEALGLARRVKQAGLKLLLDFHYSDTWADPGHQSKPAAWAALSESALESAVRSFTRDTVAQFVAQGTTPDVVQVGNEIRAGLLWPNGSTSNWTNLANLVKAGILGVRDSAASAKVMIHSDSGGDFAANKYFYDNLISRAVTFDLIGLSYYPLWHGTLADLQSDLTQLAGRYAQKIVVVETGYPWTFSTGPFTGVRYWGSGGTLAGYPNTPEGQRNFVSRVCAIVAQAPQQKGIGVLYWAPDWIGSQSYASGGDNVAWFDFQGNELPALGALGRAGATGASLQRFR